MRVLNSCLLLFLLIINYPAFAISGITINLDDIISPQFTAKRISANFTLDQSAQIKIGELNILQHSVKNVSIHCKSFLFDSKKITCAKGKLSAEKFTSDISFTFATASNQLELTIQPIATERWQLNSTIQGDTWHALLKVNQGQLTRFSSLMPDEYPRFTKGLISGYVDISGKEKNISTIKSDLQVSDVSASNKSGTQATEKLKGNIKITAIQKNKILEWRTDVDWQSGEVYWAPLYLANGGHQVNVSGTYDQNNVVVNNGVLRLANIGEANFSLSWNIKDGLEKLQTSATKLKVNALYTSLLKPFLEKTSLNQLTPDGTIDLNLLYQDKAVKQIDIVLDNVTLIDNLKRFSLHSLQANVPWRRDEATIANVSFKEAQLLGIPIGEFNVPINLHGLKFSIDEIALPILDGKLLIRNFSAMNKADDWQWQFNGVLLPISMEVLTKALDVPVMQGSLSATIPNITYQKNAVNLEGGIGIRVFDGDIGITQMQLTDPLGIAPRLNADIEMRNLDLGMVTNTFKFGSIQGRIDVDAKNMELSKWRPVKLDMRVTSSPGRYRKKISQQAIENISSLGGQGAALAIQRSFLRFFQEFRYEKIGLGCRLRNNVCEMSGIEDTNNGYLIVKGGGIPSMTVKGYNKYVGWDELIDRLSRITTGGTPTVE